MRLPGLVACPSHRCDALPGCVASWGAFERARPAHASDATTTAEAIDEKSWVVPPISIDEVELDKLAVSAIQNPADGWWLMERKPVILVVDHDLPAVGILVDLLLRRTSIVLLAASMADALAIARQTRIDSVLTSVILPDGGGKGLRERFQREPSLKHVRFFFMIGCGSPITDLSCARGVVIGRSFSTSLMHLLTGVGQHGGDPSGPFSVERNAAN